MHRFREQKDETLASRVAPHARESESVETPTVSEEVSPARSGPEPIRGFWKALRSENPVLTKELKSLYGQVKATPQQRQLTKTVNLIAIVAFYSAALLGMREILKNVAPGDERMAWYIAFSVLMGIQGFIVLITSIARLPLSIAKEREKQTWNALLLSRLTPETILTGKYGAGLISALSPVALFLPLCLLSAAMGGVELGRGLLAYAVILASAAMLTMTSLYSSWKSATSVKATNEAGGWMGALVFGAAGVWGLGFGAISLVQWFLFGATGQPIPPVVSGLLGTPMWINPLVALFCTLIPTQGMPPAWSPYMLWALPFVFLTFASTLTVGLWRKMVTKFWEAPRDFTG